MFVMKLHVKWICEKEICDNVFTCSVVLEEAHFLNLFYD